MSQIRLISDLEVPLLLPGARAFFQEGLLEGSLNEAFFVRTLQNYIRERIGFVLVAGEAPFEGALGAAIFPDFATGEQRAMEFFFYVNASHRGLAGPRLLRAYEEEARKRGAIRAMLMHLATPEAHKFVRFYERFHYRLVEQVFCKTIFQPLCQAPPESSSVQQ